MADPRIARAEAQLAAGDAAGAKATTTALLATAGAARADCRAALMLRAEAHRALGDAAKGLADLHEAVKFDPRDARTRNALGIALADSGNTRDALEAFMQAVQLDPGYARGWNNLSNVLRDAGRGADAATALERAVAADPDYALAWCNLGAIRRDLGDDVAAETAFRRSLALRGDDRIALSSLAHLLRGHGQLDEAEQYFARAAALSGADPAPLLSLAGTLAEHDEIERARAAYAQARTRRPASLQAAFGAALTLPMVYRDAAAVGAARDGYAAGLARLEEDLPALVRGRAFGELADDLRWVNFLLAYQGEDDRALQARYAALVGNAIDAVAPEWRAPRPRVAPGSRIRIGFASAHFNDGTVGRYFRRWIERLDRRRFEVFVYHVRRNMTPLAAELAAGVDRYRTFPGGALAPARVAATIRADVLDVLVYPELGMDATTFLLAALRLAPVQCAAWGHPVTTGHATIDAFLTPAAMEPADGDLHYVERLLRLPGIGTDYPRTAVPTGASRARLGLPEGVPLLLCPQSLFKIHPDNDALFARVLAAVPDARLVTFAGRHPALTAKYATRLGAACAAAGVDLGLRHVTLAQCGHDDYLRINAVCDVMLDTLRWSGGNTTLDALAAGLPPVTRPGRFMRGRQSAAMLRQAGLDELVVDSDDAYVARVARLARDGEGRRALSGRIAAAGDRWFDDPAPVAALADYLEAAVRAR